ncbi:MAG: UDP-N-acetylmuramoyl-tripeptide--D-alanyl-D-alanine ligase [Clostridiales bacterium]|nr:UDP-N-acetylmuramoyl-tripeptide--D-alanyl-D-alanine ligase [Clostridiales bacterium]
MQKLSIRELAQATGGEIINGDENTIISGISTNSREIKEGMLFVPLIGEKFDGHKFMDSAIENGAAAVLSSEDIPSGAAVIRVKDTLKAFGDIAAFYKKKYRIPTVAITGSVGKTTTKDMIYAAMSAGYNTIKTPNNFNNEIGVPMTVLSQEAEHEAAVVEMGMNHFGELSRLAGIVKPDAAVITNIGMSHIENLGSREGIFRAKMEITEGFGPDNTLIVNGDDEFLSKTKGTGAYRVIYYGIENEQNDVRARDIKSNGLGGVEFTAQAGGKDYRVKVTQPGVHNVYNALAAICVAMVFSIPVEDAVKNIGECEYTAQRLEVEEHKGIEIINDCYNASPDSVRAALSIVPYSLKARRAAVLGDMLEMGDYADKAHYEIGRFAADKLDLLITAGKSSRETARGAKEGGLCEVYSFDTTEEAAEFAKGKICPDTCVLVKASHGMHFEKIVEKIKEEFSE